MPKEPGREGAGNKRHFKGAFFYRIIDQFIDQTGVETESVFGGQVGAAGAAAGSSTAGSGGVAVVQGGAVFVLGGQVPHAAPAAAPAAANA